MEYLTRAEEDKRPDNLADDYLFGFDTGDHFQHWYLGTIVVNGCAPRDDMKHFTCLSLLRSVEQWDQMLCCANAMREKASFDDPLDGQDLLTFLTKILQPQSTSSSLDNDTKSKMLDIGYKGKGVIADSQLSQPSRSLGEASERKRKRNESPQTLDKEISSKKSGKHLESPFWATIHSEHTNNQAVQSVVNKRRLRREKRKAKKRERRAKSAEKTCKQQHSGDDLKECRS